MNHTENCLSLAKHDDGVPWEVLPHYRTLVCASLQLRHNGYDGVWHHQPRHCLPNRLYRRRSKKTSKLRVTGLCEGNSPVTGEFPAQMASDAGKVSIWRRHHGESPLLATQRLNNANFDVSVPHIVWKYALKLPRLLVALHAGCKRKRWVSQMRAPLAASREPSGSYNL